MKNIRNMIIAAIAIVSISASSLFAGSFGVGVTGSMAVVEASGKETTTGNTGVAESNQDATASNNVAIGSIFAEYTFDGLLGMTFGYEMIPGTADVNSKNLTRKDARESIHTGNDQGSRNAQAEVSNHNTIYLELPLHAGTYLKAGSVKMDVKTVDSTDVTGAGTYGDGDVSGKMFGIGYKNNFGESAFYKLEGTHTQFDSLTLQSSSAENSITADLDVTKLTFGLGYSF
tara:strand:- start:2504 stop:3193 length:690 start_codon:yes stop_codon:yes gene_type:complete